MGIHLIGPVLLFFKRGGGSSLSVLLDVSNLKLTFRTKSQLANDSDSFSPGSSRSGIDAHCLQELDLKAPTS